MNYKVDWIAEEKGTVECLNALCSVNASAVYPGAVSAPVKVSAGDRGTAFLAKNLQMVSLDGFTEKDFGGWDLAVFLDISSPKVTWRFMLTVGCALAALLLCAAVCLVLSLRSAYRGKYSPLVWILLCVFGAAALETEAAYWFFADQPYVRVLWKAVASAALIGCYFLLHRPIKDAKKLLGSLFPVILLSLGADLLLPKYYVFGGVLYLLSRAVLIIYCLRGHPMSRGRWIQWAVVSLPVSLFLIIIFSTRHGIMSWAAAACVPVLFLLRLSSVEEPVRLRFSVLLAIIADVLLMLFYLAVESPLLHAGCMFLFCLSAVLLATDRAFDRSASRKPLWRLKKEAALS